MARSVRSAQWAALSTVALFTVVFWLGLFSFESSDDMAIISLLKGLYGRVPSPEGVYISPLLGHALFFLYQLEPSVSWFSLALYCGLMLACFTGNLVALSSIRSTLGCIAALVVLSFLIYSVALRINFSAVALILYVSGLFYLTRLLLDKRPGGLYFWLASFQLAAAYLIRPSLLDLMGALSLPFILLLVSSEGRKAFLPAIAPLGAAIIINSVVTLAPQPSGSDAQYEEFNKVRSTLLDTVRSANSTNTEQARLAANWSARDLDVLKGWWIHDSNIFSTSAIKSFLEVNSSAHEIFHFDKFQYYLFSHRHHLLILFFWLLLALYSGNYLVTVKEKRSLVIGLFALIGITLLLMGVRFPKRIDIPCFYAMFLCVTLLYDKSRRKGGLSYIHFVATLLFLAVGIYVFTPVVQTKQLKAKNAQVVKENIDYMVKEVIDTVGDDAIFVDARPGNIPLNYLPFGESDPILQIPTVPSGWHIASPVYLEFIERNGLGDRSTVVASMINNPRVIFRYNLRKRYSNRYLIHNFLPHLNQHYADSGEKIVMKKVRLFKHRQVKLMFFRLITIPRSPAGD